MPTIRFNCPSCNQAYTAYVDKTTTINCRQCGKTLQPYINGRVKIITPIYSASVRQPENPKAHQKTKSAPTVSNIRDYRELIVLIGSCVVGLILYLVIHSLSSASPQQPTSKEIVAAKTSLSVPKGNSTSSAKAAAEKQAAKTIVVANAHPAENAADANNLSVNEVSLASLIASSDVTYDENFHPKAAITLNNTTSKDIAQVVFRFDFAAYPIDATTTNMYIYNECASFANVSVNLKAGETRLGHIMIPQPERKEFDKPNISIVKVLYSDGSVKEN